MYSVRVRAAREHEGAPSWCGWFHVDILHSRAVVRGVVHELRLFAESSFQVAPLLVEPQFGLLLNPIPTQT